MGTTGSAKPQAEDLTVAGTIENKTSCELTDREWHRQWGSDDPSKIKPPPKEIRPKDTATFYFCGAPAMPSGATGEVVYKVRHSSGETFVATLFYDVPWGKHENKFDFTVSDEGRYFKPRVIGKKEGKDPTPIYILDEK
jgi:hypothetical protein